MALIPKTDDPAPAGEGTPAEGTPAEGTPAEVTPAGEGTPERPDYIPEDFWGENGFKTEDFEALRNRPEAHADVPDSEEAYTLPEIEGFDTEAAADSPLFKALRKNAFGNKLGQEAFEQVVKDYVDGENERLTAFENDQIAQLGKNAEARLKKLGTWLDSSLPEDQAAAIRGLATNAASVAGLEALMNDRTSAAPRDTPAPAPSRKSKEEIRSLMKTPAYRGKAEQRDPAVVKEVDEWFAAEAAAKDTK